MSKNRKTTAAIPSVQHHDHQQQALGQSSDQLPLSSGFSSPDCVSATSTKSVTSASADAPPEESTKPVEKFAPSGVSSDMKDDHHRGSTRELGAVAQSASDPETTNRTQRTGSETKRQQNERDALERWRNEAAPQVPPGNPPTETRLWEEDNPEQEGEILIRAGKTLAFTLDEDNQCLELAEDLEKITLPKLRKLVQCVKDLIVQTVPGADSTTSVRSLFRLDRQSHMATPTIRVRFKYAPAAAGAVAALESRLRKLMDLAGSVTDALFLAPATELLPNEPEAARLVELAKQIRTIAPKAALAPDLEMSSVLFGAPVALPERIGLPPPKDDDLSVIVEATGEIDGFGRTGRLASVLLSGRRTSTTLAADMEVFFPLLQLLSPIVGNVCRVWYLPGEDQSGKGKLLRLKIESLGLFAEMPAQTVAESPQFAEAQSAGRPSEPGTDAESMTTQSTSAS